MRTALINLKHLLHLAFLSLPVVFLLAVILLAPEAPRVVLRTVIGVLAALGCYEVLLYSAGYTSRTESLIPLRLSLRSPSPPTLLEYVSLFVLTGSTFKLLEGIFQVSNPVVIALSMVAAYFLRRTLKSVLTGGGLKRMSAAVFVVGVVFSTTTSDSDIRYLQNLLKLLDEVVRNVL